MAGRSISALQRLDRLRDHVSPAVAVGTVCTWRGPHEHRPDADLRRAGRITRDAAGEPGRKPVAGRNEDRWGNTIRFRATDGQQTLYRYNVFGALAETRLPFANVLDTRPEIQFLSDITGDGVFDTGGGDRILVNYYDRVGRQVASVTRTATSMASPTTPPVRSRKSGTHSATRSASCTTASAARRRSRTKWAGASSSLTTWPIARPASSPRRGSTTG